MNDRTYVYAIHIGTTAEKLWDALTLGEFTQHYWGGRRIESTWEVGAPVRHIKPDGSNDWQGEILECDWPKKLAYTFYTPGGDEDPQNPSRVTWEISPSGPSTVLLQITHECLSEKKLKGISGGWPAILSNLKTWLESGAPLAFYWKG